jgi:hypothetical protein
MTGRPPVKAEHFRPLFILVAQARFVTKKPRARGVLVEINGDGSIAPAGLP